MDSLIFTIINLAAVVTVHAIAVVATLFVILYLRSQWNRNSGGRPFMLMAVAFSAFVDGTIIRYWVPIEDTPYRRIIDLTIYLGVLIGWLWLLVTLIKAQRAASRERKAGERGPRLRRQFPWRLVSVSCAAGAVALLLWSVLH